jgi:hypothetical protein
MDKDAILSAGAPKTTEVEIEGLGTVCLRKLTQKGREDFGRMANENKPGLIPFLASISLVVDGKLTFDNSAGREALGQLDGEVMDHLADAILRLNKLREEKTDDEPKTAEAEAEKNDSAPQSDSTTA